jgi:hypothetical protein
MKEFNTLLNVNISEKVKKPTEKRKRVLKVKIPMNPFEIIQPKESILMTRRKEQRSVSELPRQASV